MFDTIVELEERLRLHRVAEHLGLPCECDLAREYADHECSDGYTMIRNDNGVLEYAPCEWDHDAPPMTLANLCNYTTKLIRKEAERAVDRAIRIAYHECHWEAHDSDTYVLPCNVCGSDGNV